MKSETKVDLLRRYAADPEGTVNEILNAVMKMETEESIIFIKSMVKANSDYSRWQLVDNDKFVEYVNGVFDAVFGVSQEVETGRHEASESLLQKAGLVSG